MFEDIGLFWGLDKCATINIVRGKLQTNEENVSISDTEELKILDTDDHYKFLGKYENSVQLEQQVCNEATIVNILNIYLSFGQAISPYQEKYLLPRPLPYPHYSTTCGQLIGQ